jgi:hypothetical protein
MSSQDPIKTLSAGSEISKHIKNSNGLYSVFDLIKSLVMVIHAIYLHIAYYR